MDILSLIPGGGLGAMFGALGALLLAALGLFFKGRSSGKATEQAKQAQRDLKAKDDQLEMHREATAQERAARDLSDEEARKEAERWSRKR